MFSSVAYPRAGLLSNDFRTFVSAGEVRAEHLRNVCIRAFDQLVPPSDLRRKLNEFSAINAKWIDYLARRSDSGPLLAAMHVRFDTKANEFDLHMHIVWDAPTSASVEIEAYLRKRYADVWIDAEPVRDPGKLAFYLVRNVFPHADLEVWPDAALLAAWDGTHGFKFVRRAGAFLAATKQASQSPLSSSKSPADDALNAVRTLSPESFAILRKEIINDVTRWPTVAQAAVVLSFLDESTPYANPEIALADNAHAPFEDFVNAVDRMEMAFQAPLFNRSDWTPTRQGKTIAKRGMPLVRLINRAYSINGEG